MDLVLTTIPHLLILNFSPDDFYSGIVLVSTLTSIAWHSVEGFSAEKCIGILDHFLAGIWFLTDLYYSYQTQYYYKILYFNIFVGGLNILIYPVINRTKLTYEQLHSIWHLISVLKGLYVVNCIN